MRSGYGWLQWCTGRTACAATRVEMLARQPSCAVKTFQDCRSAMSTGRSEYRGPPARAAWRLWTQRTPGRRTGLRTSNNARDMRHSLTEGYACAREPLTRAQVVASGSGRDAGQAHASDTTCTGGLQWQLAPSKSQTCRRLTVPRTQWAPGRIPASRRKAFGKH